MKYAGDEALWAERAGDRQWGGRARGRGWRRPVGARDPGTRAVTLVPAQLSGSVLRVDRGRVPEERRSPISGMSAVSVLCQQAGCGRPDERGLVLYLLSPPVFSECNTRKYTNESVCRRA